MGWKRQRKGGEAGYTLALVVVMASVLLVTLSEAVLNWQTAVKREREEELIFRGEQYQRALILWYAHWSRTLGRLRWPIPAPSKPCSTPTTSGFFASPGPIPSPMRSGVSSRWVPTTGPC